MSNGESSRYRSIVALLESPSLLHHHFWRQAAATPDSIALSERGRTARYEELARDVARLAGALRSRGVAPGMFIGLHLERSIDSVVATLALLTVGAAVVPLPPTYPETRRRQILEFSGLEGVLDGPATPIGSLYAGPVFRADDSSGTPFAEGEPVAPDHPAFVLCSSGSTGTPKMIVRSHRSFFHRLRWTWREHPFGEGERCIQKSHMTTTHSIYELFEPLLAGVPVLIVGDEEVRDLEGFWETIKAQGVTRLLIVPSLLRASLDMPEFAPPPLRTLTLMGEAVDGALADRAAAAFASVGSIVSIYGSTEASSTHVVDLRASRAAGAAPELGVPLDESVEAVVLDDDLCPVAEGEVGMLYIAGAPLFTEYFKDPEGTAAACAEGPDGSRRYRTNDRVRLGSHGALQYVGRAGDTVKVRGFRVDLREVEAALATTPGVRHAAAVPLDDRLIAFVAPATVSPADVTRVVTAVLPAPMIPALIVPLDEFPRAANGKIDRRRLAVEWVAREANVGIVSGSGSERHVAKIWRDVLGPVTIEPSTNFFEAGGTSLTVFAVVHRLRTALGLTREQLTELTIYRNPTVEALARHLGEIGEGSVQSAEAAVAEMVVSLKSGADPGLDPVFLIAAAGGSLGSYDRVVARLSGPRPLLGIRDPFLWGGRDATSGFLDWVDRYVEAVTTRQPTGPYRIVAYSSAAAFGYEIARRLRQGGAEVARLVLVDPVGLDSSSRIRYGHWALRARWMPPLLVRGILAWGRLRALVPVVRDGPPGDWRLTEEAYGRFAEEVRRDPRHFRRLSALLELTSGLPVALGESELAVVPPEGYTDLLFDRFRSAGSDVERAVVDRLVVQYELQVRTQHRYRLSRLDCHVSLFAPATPYAGLLAAQFRPYVRRLDARVLPIGAPSEQAGELSETFDPGIRSHYLCMRDDAFTKALAAELDRVFRL